MKKSLQLLAESIKREEQIITLNKDLYSAVNKVKRVSENRWKVFIPLIITAVAAGVAVAIPDPFEPLEIGLAVTGWATLATVFGEEVKLIIQFSKYGKGVELLNALRDDYCIVRESVDILYLSRKKSINASQLEFPPVLYIDNSLKYDVYDDNLNIAFLTKSCASEWKSLRSIELKDNKDFGYCKNGTVFIKHPFLPNTYLELEDALSDTHQIMHEKISCISTIIHSLGATNFTGKAQFVKEENVNINNKSEISHQVVKLSAKVTKDKNDRLQQAFTMTQTGTGQFSIEDFARAKKLAEDYGLNNDPDIRALLQIRDPANSNIQKSYNLNYELTKEINKTLDIAGDLIINGISLNNNYESIIKKREVINYTMNIEF